MSADPRTAGQWVVDSVGSDRLIRKIQPKFAAVQKGQLSVRSVLEEIHLELLLAELAGLYSLSLPEEMQLPLLGDALVFASAAHNLHQYLGETAKRRHLGMLRAAMDSDSGFSALRTEYVAAAFALGQGCHVTPIDLEGLGNYDFLLTSDEEEIELECKMLSNDFGNPFASTRIDRLMLELNTKHREALLKPGTARKFWLELGADLPSSNDGVRELAVELVRLAGGAEASSLSLVKSFRIEDWEGGREHPDRAFSEARFITSLHFCPTFEFHDEKAAIIFALKDGFDSGARYRDRFKKKFKEAADQFSGTRPAALFVEVQGPCPDRYNVELIRKSFKLLMPEVFEARPFVELLVLCFAGPPFTAGVSYAIRNERRRRGNQTFLMRRLERASLSKKRTSGALPGSGFRKQWWQEKFNWSYKSKDEFSRELSDRFGVAVEKVRQVLGRDGTGGA